MHRHLMKCKKCPKDVKALLDRLYIRHAEEMGSKVKKRRGGKILFYRQIWKSLHPDANDHQTCPVATDKNKRMRLICSL